MSANFNVVVLAGGVGSRLWPLSRSSFPKQYQRLVSSEAKSTMLQQTFSRLSGLNVGTTQIVCNQEHRFLAAEQCRDDDIDAQIVLEPMGRNTAAPVIVAALRLIDAENDMPILVLSADHSISDDKSFRLAVTNGYGLASDGNIVTLGVKPSYACTGYGYIGFGNKVGGGFEVLDFKEKPGLETANEYLKLGNYVWNSGMFIVRPSVLIKEASLYCPELLENCRRVVRFIKKDLDFIRLPEKQFSQCEDISLDYAIMEHTKTSLVVPLNCGWSDVGDLHALWEVNERDADGNVLQGDVKVLGSFNSLIKSESRLVVALGVEGLAIIETKDAILVTPLAKSQEVKEVHTLLHDRSELVDQREVYRPWGSYDSVDHGTNYQVKRISVNPGARLSLQRHKYRAEHWVVVVGVATVYLDENEYTLEANESIYIPLGSVHALANNSKEPLHLIEVQSGSYLGEDDIERFEDLYGRI